MRTILIQANVIEYEGVEELTVSDLELLNQARLASDNAYAPYSRFHVGAALLLANGVVVTGNNQENAAYPSGLCAERVAFFSASSQYPGVAFRHLAIFARSLNFVVESPAAPCGACRQVMAEYEHKFGQHVRITIAGERGKILQFESVEGLLPLMFTSNDLIK